MHTYIYLKDFTVTEEKYNGTFIHGHTSREGQPMPTLSQEEVNELLKNASTILNQNSEEDGKSDKKNNKKKNEKPIDLTPENILKQHKTYQEEMMENEKDDKINQEIESTMEKLFFSDEKKDNAEADKNNKKNTKNKSSLIEEMTEIVPESKKSEAISEEGENKNNKNESKKKNDEKSKNENKNQFIELEGNGIPKIIDLLDDHSSDKKEQQNEKDTAISEAESKIFDFLKEFDDNTGKITELDDSNNEIPPSKIEELNENDEFPPSKIEELKDDISLNINKNDKVYKNEQCINKNKNIPIVEEPTHNNDTIPIIEEPNNNNETTEIDEKLNNKKDSTPIIEEIIHDHDFTSNIDDINSNNDNTPKIEEITHDNDLSLKIEENSMKPKIEEPPHLNDLNDSEPIIEEPLHNNDKVSNNESNQNNNTPIIEEITTHTTETFTNISNNDNNSPKIEDVTHNNNDNDKVKNKDEDIKINKKEPSRKESIQEQLEREQKQLIEDINKLSIRTKNEENDPSQFKTIEIPVKEKPKYLLKTSEHYLYIKVKLPKLVNITIFSLFNLFTFFKKKKKKLKLNFIILIIYINFNVLYNLLLIKYQKLIKSLQWNLSNCKTEESRPNTEKWLSVSSPEYDLKIRLDTQFLDLNNIRVTFTKSTEMLILRFNRILN